MIPNRLPTHRTRRPTTPAQSGTTTNFFSTVAVASCPQTMHTFGRRSSSMSRRRMRTRAITLPRSYLRSPSLPLTRQLLPIRASFGQFGVIGDQVGEAVADAELHLALGAGQVRFLVDEPGFALGVDGAAKPIEGMGRKHGRHSSAGLQPFIRGPQSSDSPPRIKDGILSLVRLSFLGSIPSSLKESAISPVMPPRREKHERDADDSGEPARSPSRCERRTRLAAIRAGLWASGVWICPSARVAGCGRRR